MKWLVRIILISVTLLSLTVNGLLLVSQTGFQILSGLLNNLGLNTPVTSLQKSNADLKKKNSRLVNQNKKIKRSINNYSKTRSKKMVVRASQKAANAATKSAAIFLPVVSSAVLAGGVVLDGLDVVRMCEEMEELDSLLKSIDINDDKELDAKSDTTLAKVKVCQQNIVTATKVTASEILGDIDKFSDSVFRDYSLEFKAISSGLEAKLDDSVNSLIEWNKQTEKLKTCDVIGKDTCDALAVPIETLCSLSNNKLWGCIGS